MVRLVIWQSERDFVKVPGSGRTGLVEGYSSGSKVEAFGSAASRDCNSRSQP
jgi:hypothetical protein